MVKHLSMLIFSLKVKSKYQIKSFPKTFLYWFQSLLGNYQGSFRGSRGKFGNFYSLIFIVKKKRICPSVWTKITQNLMILSLRQTIFDFSGQYVESTT